ncbi:hypothetical protein SynA1560_01835 [Synechococcus sp. A15-60]|nr:hypothetical protein SynA1560_01835 [Synechococcus sp. A15-60]
MPSLGRKSRSRWIGRLVQLQLYVSVTTSPSSGQIQTD